MNSRWKKINCGIHSKKYVKDYALLNYQAIKKIKTTLLLMDNYFYKMHSNEYPEKKIYALNISHFEHNDKAGKKIRLCGKLLF